MGECSAARGMYHCIYDVRFLRAVGRSAFVAIRIHDPSKGYFVRTTTDQRCAPYAPLTFNGRHLKYEPTE